MRALKLGLTLGSGGVSKPNGNPSALTLTVLSDTSIKCDWTNGATNQDGTYVYISTDNVNFTNNATALGSLTTKTLTGLSENTTYYIKIVYYKGSKLSEYSSVSSETTTINLSSLSDKIFWYNSQSVTDIGGYADAAVDLSGNDRGLSAVAEENRPQIITNDLNGYPALLFDGVKNRLIKIGTTINQPIALYVVAMQTASESDAAIVGGTTSPHVAIVRYTTNSSYGIYAGATLNGANSENKLNIPMLFQSKINGNSSGLYWGGKQAEGAVGANALKGIELGGYANADAFSGDSKIYEVIAFSSIPDDATHMLIKRFFDIKYHPQYEIYDGIFHNSVEYANKTTYKIRSAFSEYRFNYSETKLYLKAIGMIESRFPDYSHIAVFINGVFNQKVSYPRLSSTYIEITLPAGNKEVRLVEGLTTRYQDAGDVLGTHIYGLMAGSSYAKIAVTNVAEKIVFIGDSITVGGNSETPANEAFPRLFYTENSKEVEVLGWGFAKMASFAIDAAAITAALGYITYAFSNVITTKKLVIALGTNDAGLDGTSTATYKTMYESLLDAIHAADSTIVIYCISPIFRNDAIEASKLVDYRTAVSEVCAARDYTTHINGGSILAYPSDYNDTVHPNTLGHSKYKNVIYPIICS